MEGKKYVVIFEDGERAAKRIGFVTSEDDFCITLNHFDIIPRRRIIRMELLRGEEMQGGRNDDTEN